MVQVFTLWITENYLFLMAQRLNIRNTIAPANKPKTTNFMVYSFNFSSPFIIFFISLLLKNNFCNKLQKWRFCKWFIEQVYFDQLPGKVLLQRKVKSLNITLIKSESLHTVIDISLIIWPHLTYTLHTVTISLREYMHDYSRLPQHQYWRLLFYMSN